ncbi:glycosyltransferase family protein [Fundidesulfovibrio terrae]|uniref:glycosyltransferase family protein n=1 Tax=Fundidesulfovibrio terrae TaxID=2922866 RepID=UPI001FB017B7|nr:glycosyltransferase family protein [Fundidesulfovibrio terrae]
MARILYGVHGSQHGHAIRALTLARRFSEHEFLFVTSEEAAGILRGHYPVETALNPGTRYKNYALDLPATVKLAAKTFIHRGRELTRIGKVIERFKPDVCLSDYEYFVPIAAKRAGVPCLSLDHQHVITLCEHDLPGKVWWDLTSTSFSVNNLFSNSTDHLVISFYQPPLKPGPRRAISPPIHREKVFEHEATVGDHILVYQSCSICENFVPLLKTLGRPVIVYGYGKDATDGNLSFKKFSEDGLLSDMASCNFVICGGGHTLMSEALCYGKPIISLPVKGAFEQWLNAHYLQKLGYGLHLDMHHLDEAAVAGFESQVEACRERVRAVDFKGNEFAFSLVERFIRQGNLPGVANRRLVR